MSLIIINIHCAIKTLEVVYIGFYTTLLLELLIGGLTRTGRYNVMNILVKPI